MPSEALLIQINSFESDFLIHLESFLINSLKSDHLDHLDHLDRNDPNPIQRIPLNCSLICDSCDYLQVIHEVQRFFCLIRLWNA